MNDLCSWFLQLNWSRDLLNVTVVYDWKMRFRKGLRTSVACLQPFFQKFERGWPMKFWKSGIHICEKVCLFFSFHGCFPNLRQAGLAWVKAANWVLFFAYLERHLTQSWEYRMKFGISVFRYLLPAVPIFRYRNTEHNIGTDTDTYWMIPNDFFRNFWTSLADKESS